MKYPNTSAVILAAGQGSRFGGKTTKQQVEIGGESVLSRTVKAFDRSEYISSVVIVCKSGEESFANEVAGLCEKKVLVVPGGDTRQESAKIGVLSAKEDVEFVAIADAARCMIQTSEIDRVLCTAYETGAASAVRRVNDTVKRIGENGEIYSSFNRSELRLAETPQVFRKKDYLSAVKQGEKDGFSVTDDNALMEHAGFTVVGVEMTMPNLKITTPADAEMAEYLLKGKRMTEYRIGHGYDVHKLTEGRKLILGGVEIPHSVGLLGHSDADVLVHAIMDAILGAIGEGDIGRHFPDNDDAYLGISSLLLLGKVAELLKEKNASVVNIDATVVMQKPKLAPYIKIMEENLAKTLGIDVSRVNVKATTEEHLGFTGSGEGAAAHAVACVSM